ncbi:MAG: hypothetical protein KDJ65_07385 [Anaerolineae bacterium]|nr:hypothetical protein [Anaerolineae bacterium]
MEAFLEKNNAENRRTIPYYITIKLAPITTSHFPTRYQIPIYLKPIRGQNHYTAELCGLNVQESSPQSVLNTINKVAPTLVNLNRMPTYVFIARHSLKVYPVYTNRKENLGLTVPNGPVARHVELAYVRDRVGKYLNDIHVLGRSGEYEKLHVRGVHQKTLALVRPIFYLKKRPLSPKDTEFWTPVFPSDESASIYAYVLDKKYEVSEETGNEVFQLRSQVSRALIGKKRLSEDFDLRADRLLSDYWAKLETKLEPLPEKLIYNNATLPLYQHQGRLIAVEKRADEDRYSLYLGHDREDLRQRAGNDLARRSIINDLAAVELTT